MSECPREVEFAKKLQEIDDRSKSNTHRLNKLEESTETLNRLAASMEVMAEKQDRVADTVDKLDGKVTAMEQKPGKRWDAIVEKVIMLIVGAVMACIFTKVGL